MLFRVGPARAGRDELSGTCRSRRGASCEHGRAHLQDYATGSEPPEDKSVRTRRRTQVSARATAVNGIEVVARIAAERHDVVLMECQMPELDGFEATRVVRECEAIEGGHVRIVAMIANAMAGDRDRCIASGMDD